MNNLSFSGESGFFLDILFGSEENGDKDGFEEEEKGECGQRCGETHDFSAAAGDISTCGSYGIRCRYGIFVKGYRFVVADFARQFGGQRRQSGSDSEGYGLYQELCGETTETETAAAAGTDTKKCCAEWGLDGGVATAFAYCFDG